MTQTPGPRLTPLALSLPSSVPFVGPETHERAQGRVFAARLGANESVFGPSQRAIEAMQRAAQEVWKYADPESYELRAALAAHHGVGMDNIIVGEGIDGLLGYLVRLLVAPGDRVVTTAGAYPTFNFHVTGYGGVLETVPFLNDHENPQALIEKAGATSAKLLYLANPDNPMGSWHDGATVQAMIEAVPEGSLMVLDEAYVEFAPKNTAPPIDVSDARVIRMRTFSKAYGMAGARVGYAIGAADVIKAFHKIRNHFGMCRLSQAGALAALADQEYLAQVVSDVAKARDRIGQIALNNGLTALPSATNFVAVDCGEDGDFARRVVAEIVARGVFVRMPFSTPEDRCIRVSAGTPHDLDLFEAALPEALSAARA
ncbi:MAG: pyridoxal phosphate-dependent aminotransferase [Maritimibacter sp.]